jgi:S-DNA-T family DNA segregation ATPase FtsK/SpoIIIE
MRFCLKVLGHHANDMVLGSGMWRAGYQAATFAFEDKGIGLLAGEGDAPRIVRTAYVDGRQAEQVVARARAMRVAAGTITGHAAGEDIEPAAGPDYSLLADLLTVMGEEKAHSDVLCERLAEQWPDRYAGWAPETLAQALKPLGLKTQRQVWAERPDGTTGNRAGLRRADLVTAADARV